MKLFSIIALAIMAFLSVLGFCEFVIFKKRVKAAENKVRLRVNSHRNEIVWCILCILWILLSKSRYRTACERGYESEAETNMLLIIIWSVALFNYLFRLIFVRHIYITDNAVIVFNDLKNMYQNTNYRYRIMNDENILELYYKKNSVPIKYKIIEEKERLTLKLKENYELYIENDSCTS